MPIDMEPYWKQLEICEADLARLKKQGGETEAGWEEATKAVETMRVNIKELQRIDRARVPDDPPWANNKPQRRQEDAPWIEDGWSGQR
jgi:hypothetical protein